MTQGFGDFSEEELTEAFEYLDELRSSGRVNMWGAHAFLARDLLWPDKEASAATGLWMNTFDKERGVPERVAQAIEAQRAATVQQGAVEDESAVPERNAP
jgi:hypothetical protein